MYIKHKCQGRTIRVNNKRKPLLYPSYTDAKAASLRFLYTYLRPLSKLSLHRQNKQLLVNQEK